uniref:Neur_chan_memb domain-containing protein n=1 Tax=Ascaris lumbricoides TaxID=6252 RepID=A0A0M3HV55_ASCLU
MEDLMCFVWKYADRHTVCDALTGVAIPPIIMFIEIILLTYTMTSVRCEILIPSQVTLTCGLISVGLEMCLEGALYMTIKIVPGPDFNAVAERRGNGSPVPGMYGSSNADYEQISGSIAASRQQVTYVSTAF